MTSHRTVFERQAPAARQVTDALRGSRRAVFWLEDVETFDRPSLTGTIDADLTVVGGGYCGLWTALLAKRRDPTARVVLLEAETIGWAASGRNGGFAEASLTHGEDNGRRRWPEDYDTLHQMGLDNLDAIERDVAELKMDVQLERTGVLEVAYEPHQVRWLQESGRGEWLDRDAVQAEIASPVFHAGRWVKDECALVHPGRLVHELARVAADLGVEIFEHSAVSGLGSGRTGRVDVRTTRGLVRSRTVALATNVFRPLLRRSRLSTVPVYDYVLMTEPLSPAQMSDVGWAHRQGVSDLANQFHYSRLTADDRILYGGYDAVYHAGRRVRPEHEDRDASYRRLASHFLTTYPQLEGLGFSHRWAGAIDTSTQFCAFHGLARRGRVAYAAGFTGLGVAATRFAAEVMLDRLAGDATPRTQLQMVRRKPLPFPPEPFAKIGIEATKWSLDRADHHEGRRNLMLRTLDRLGLGFDS
ncbi:NAD(P)/FAD-dependent oxidoreductase [Aeromicrobium chenweiae]|uniref:FAD-dependent oxidoreductase n=1 Tax=Aeromicrobium chenweiae TaxID=2079793 RepID=A0A2S0WJM2_9ACTN|nr:FAD-dependent oxidoreductase [Aeromicrobium chenweiae]AWB91539.1 FAD-dependent oxidoreductase [Aeromicrobium chenweiae]TGN32374.1 FAD-dependent oxidoreductase [Aeromicrobium chenweiae]